MEKTNHVKEALILRRVIKITGGIAVLTGIFVIVLWAIGKGSLASILPDYKPMSPDTAIISAGFGLILYSGAYRTVGRMKKFLITLVLFILSSYAFLMIIEYFIETNLTVHTYFFQEKLIVRGFQANSSSPVSGSLFLLGGVAILIRIFGHERVKLMNMIASTGMILLYVGFVGLIGYFFGEPLLYGGNITPLSMPTTLVFFLLGFGILAMGGMKSFIFRSLSGTSGRAMILRSLLPILCLILIFDEWMDVLLANHPLFNFIFASTVLVLLMIPIGGWLVIRVTHKVFEEAEEAGKLRDAAEQALRNSEEQFRNLTYGAHDAIIVIGQDGRIRVFNPAAERIFGYSVQEALAMPVDVLVPDGYANNHKKIIQRYSETGHSTVIGRTRELTGKRKDGGIFPIELSLSEFRVGDEISFTGIIRDISERKETEAKLEQFTDELIESNATKDKFFSIISHDLRSPFNGILGLTNILLKDYRSMDEQEIKLLLGTLQKASEKAFDLTENLLLWANTQTNKISYLPMEFNLHSAIDEVVAIAKAQAAKKNIRLISDGAIEQIVFGDKQMVNTIMRNLISNAIKFTPLGGTVVVSVARLNHHCEISVKDTGIGIPEEHIPHIFNIERKYNTNGTSNESGTGLGLILCREFVENHGEKIWVESKYGKGTTFTFTLPWITDLGEKSISNNTVSQGGKALQLTNLKILVAEDDLSSDLIITRMLKKISREILHARTGVETVEVCRNNPDLDIILMDIRMPEMSGDEATRQIRQFNQDVIIIAQTADGFAGDRNKAIEAGCNDYIAKPVVEDELLAMIRMQFKPAHIS